MRNGAAPCSPWSSALPPCESKINSGHIGRAAEGNHRGVRPRCDNLLDRASRYTLIRTEEARRAAEITEDSLRITGVRWERPPFGPC